jgi:hypothetical protein
MAGSMRPWLVRKVDNIVLKNSSSGYAGDRANDLPRGILLLPLVVFARNGSFLDIFLDKFSV